ncbi:unnamed protein product, partial [Gulo gulo]
GNLQLARERGAGRGSFQSQRPPQPPPWAGQSVTFAVAQEGSHWSPEAGWAVCQGRQCLGGMLLARQNPLQDRTAFVRSLCHLKQLPAARFRWRPASSTQESQRNSPRHQNHGASPAGVQRLLPGQPRFPREAQVL